MSCVPQSGGCERTFIEPFVAFLNETFGSQYQFVDCLDRRDSTKSQPEALYIDSVRGGRLVVERKSISWPADFPHRHANDHFVANIFSEELKEHQFESELFELALPMLIHGSKRELRSFARASAKKIDSAWSQVLAGKVLYERVTDKWWWSFRRVPDLEKDPDEPTEGLKFSWQGKLMQLGDYIDPADLPTEIVRSVHDIFDGCVRKFQSYVDAERILLLDPCGDLKYKDSNWWKQVFLRIPPPTDISAIWSGTFDDEWQSWAFERVPWTAQEPEMIHGRPSQDWDRS